MAEVTRHPNETVVVDQGGLRYQLTYDIANVPTITDALTAAGVPRYNDPHPERPDVLCSNVSVTGRGGQATQIWVLTATYSIPERTLHRDPDKRLGEAPILSWRTGVSQEAIDLDIYDNPIVNSAGEGFRNPYITTVPLYFLTVRRWENGWSPRTMLKYGNKVNADKFFGVDPGQAFCHHVHPSQDSDRTSPIVQVEYHFEFREDGFEARMKDQGFNELLPAQAGDPGGLKPILLPDGTPVTTDSPLNGFGRPFDRTRVFDRGNANNPLVDGAGLQLYDRAAYLRYVVKKSARFGELNLE